MRQYSWTLMRPGTVPKVGMGTLDELEMAVHRNNLPGIPSAAWLIEKMKHSEDLTGSARYHHAMGKSDEWRFAWIAVHA